MTGTRRGQPLPGQSWPGQDCGYLLSLKPGADLTAEDLARLARLDDGPFEPDQDDDPYGAGFGPDACLPDGWGLLSRAEQQCLLNGDTDGPAGPEILDAGFTHRDGGDGRGFAAGGALDQMEAGVTLATFADRVWPDGLGGLSDDELVGLMAAQRRLASRAAAGELAAIEELAAAGWAPTAVRVSTCRRRSRRR
jgi:hypothetical protein